MIRFALPLLAAVLAVAAALAQTPDSDLQPSPDASTDSGYTPDKERRTSVAHALSAGDHDIYARAFDAADRGDWTAAKSIALQGHDAVATRLVTWRYLLDRTSGASFAEIDNFLKNNPDWPLRDTLFARAEMAMDPAMTPSAVIAWFANRDPATGIGMIRLGDAMIATGKTADGRKMVQRGWISGDFPPDQELAIVQKDGGLFTPAVDRARLANLISRDAITAAQRELSRVEDDVQALGRARIALRTNRAQGEKLAASLPADLAKDPDLLFDRARAARRANDLTSAGSLIQRAASHGFLAAHTARWWGEAQITVRDLLATNDNHQAYAVIAHTGLSSGMEFAESEFLAGWIALRRLHDPRTALVHFKRLEAGVSRPISLSRARYWKGRCYEALGVPADAYAQYKLAAQAPESFYGQLALARIDATPVLHVTETVLDARDQADAFDKDPLSRPIRVLADLGQVNFVRIFALHDQDLHPEPKRVKYLMQALTELGFREVALRIAKSASYGGVTFLDYTHPVIPLPTYAGPGSAPDAALVLGLIRQETEFDPTAVSHSGAKGLMQMMPGSARDAAARAGIAYRPNDLMDPSYNIQLGMNEFSGDVQNFGGSLVLAIAAYNAGPGNAKKWIAANGDPRSPATDPVDWIEMIPFSETRNYVMRVLENTQIYRDRLAGKDLQTRILADLYAPNAPPDKVLSPFPDK